MTHLQQPEALWVAGDGFGSAGLAALACDEYARVVRFSCDPEPLPADAPVETIQLPPDIDRYGECVEAAASLGRPSALVCNFVTLAPEARLHESGEEQRQKSFHELDAYSFFAKRSLKYLPDGGTIVNVVPACGLVPAGGQALRSAVSAAVIAASRAWALELARRDIRVCAVALGLTEELPESLGYTAAGRAVTPRDLYGLVRYLTGSGAEMVNGACIPLDGGYAAGYCRNF